MSHLQSGKDQELGLFQVALLAFTVLLLATLVLETAFSLPKELSDLIHFVDTFGCAVFFFDFCYRFYRAESKLAFMKWGWIDLIACIPNLELFRWARLARVLRVIRLLRGVRYTHLVGSALFRDTFKGGLTSLLFLAMLLVGFSSASILICERDPDSNIKTAEDAIWWSIATMTTVGYGDVYPKTTEGRAIGIVLMIAGISIYGCISGLATSAFLSGRRKEPDNKAVLERLDRLEQKLDKISQTGSASPERLLGK